MRWDGDDLKGKELTKNVRKGSAESALLRRKQAGRKGPGRSRGNAACNDKGFAVEKKRGGRPPARGILVAITNLACRRVRFYSAGGKGD